MTVTANNVVTAQTPGRGIVRFVGTTDAAGTDKAIYTAGANGSKVYGLTVTNGATAHNATLAINNGGTRYVLNTVSLTVNAGQNGTVLPIAAMSVVNWPGLAVDSNGNPYLLLASGDTLEAQYATAQGTADTISISCLAADF